MCLRKHWDRENVRHQILPYGELYTASRLAQERHLAEKESALVVILKVADRLVMSIVPARG